MFNSSNFGPMGLFSRNKILRDTGFLQGATDQHSHILPGVDDGFRNMEDSLKALALFEENGLKDLWLTPHIMEEYPNEIEDLKARFEELKEAYKGPIKLHLGAENMLDPLFENRLRSRNFLPVGTNLDHLLVETSYFTPPSNFRGLLRQIKIAGYNVLLAHPERYGYMDYDDYKDLKEEGIKFQINFGSLAGSYGESARIKAEWLLKKNFVDAFGSDAHTVKFIKDQLGLPVKKDVAKRLLEISQKVI